MLEWLTGLWEGLLDYLATGPEENVTGMVEPKGES